MGVFLQFLSGTSGTKSRKASNLDWSTNAYAVSLNSKTPINQPIGIYELVHWIVDQKEISVRNVCNKMFYLHLFTFITTFTLFPMDNMKTNR